MLAVDSGLHDVRTALVGALMGLARAWFAAPVDDERAAVAVLAAAPEHRMEGIDRLPGQLRHGQATQQRADVEANCCFVAGACGDLHVQYVEVAVHELIDRGAGARVALLVDLPDEAGAYLFRFGQCPRTGGNCLGEVMPFSGKRVDTRIYLYAEGAAGQGLDQATLAS